MSSNPDMVVQPFAAFPHLTKMFRKGPHITYFDPPPSSFLLFFLLTHGIPRTTIPVYIRLQTLSGDRDVRDRWQGSQSLTFAFYRGENQSRRTGRSEWGREYGQGWKR